MLPPNPWLVSVSLLGGFCGHRCPCWLIWLKHRGPWGTWWFNQLPGPANCPQRIPMVAFRRQVQRLLSPPPRLLLVVGSMLPAPDLAATTICALVGSLVISPSSALLWEGSPTKIDCSRGAFHFHSFQVSESFQETAKTQVGNRSGD